jgi:hypothetical protein
MSTNTAVENSLTLQRELFPGAFALPDAASHNGSLVTGSGPLDVTTPREPWAFAVLFPSRRPESGGPSGVAPFLVRVEAVVRSGRIGIGCVAADLRTYLSAEIERTPEDGDTVFDMIVEPVRGETCRWLVVRNAATGGAPSRVLLKAIRTFALAVPHLADLIEVEPQPLKSPAASLGPDAPVIAANLENERAEFRELAERSGRQVRQFSVLLTHTSRSWDLGACSRDSLTQRYADPGRLRNLTRFEKLPPYRNQRTYSGGLSILELAVTGDAVHLLMRRCIDSRFKIQHANLVGERLVLCFEDFLAVLPSMDAPLTAVDLRPGAPWRIDDNWFGGLHTVFPVNDDVCVVSSSAADAVLWVDLTKRAVIQRWRLPAELYGVNYDLRPHMSVVDHFIPNDIQLGHLNCAYPDGKGGVFISTLIQGDIGHLDGRGSYSLLKRGVVGCHGVRLSRNGQRVYFTDSCGGSLMQIEPGNGAVELQRVDSQWLHDVEQVTDDLYCFCLGDKNEVAFIDVGSGRELRRYDFETRGANVQFITTIPES